jgi:hypothetical protein
MTTHNNDKRQTSMLPAGFEPTIPASERPQIHALDGAATGISKQIVIPKQDISNNTIFKQSNMNIF